jgi:MFS family permease
MPRTKLLSNRAFALLVAGEAASLIGDQAARVGSIWLVLELTNSPAAVGAWLAVGVLPRTVFLLLGGALTDRFDGQRMMLVSSLTRAVLVGGLASLILMAGVTMPALYLFAALFGATGALYAPAISTVLPQILSSEALQRGNAIVQGLMHVAALVGPPLAAALLAGLLGNFGAARGGANNGLVLYAILFTLCAILFALCAWALTKIKGVAPTKAQTEPVWRSIAAGFGFVMRQPQLRTFVLIAVAANFGLGGPLAVGLPLLAKFVLPQGVVALGFLSAAAAAGGLLGLGAAAVLPQQRPRRLFAMPFFILPVLGLLMISLAWSATLEHAAGVVAAMVAMAVYLDVQVLTWLQQTTEPDYLGRVMGILQFSALGLTPISMALAGLVGVNLTLTFVGFGGFILMSTAILAIVSRRGSNSAV